MLLDVSLLVDSIKAVLFPGHESPVWGRHGDCATSVYVPTLGAYLCVPVSMWAHERACVRDCVSVIVCG
jgi:hypothetical protein